MAIKFQPNPQKSSFDDALSKKLKNSDWRGKLKKKKKNLKISS